MMVSVRVRAVTEGGPLSIPHSKFGCQAVPVRAIAHPRLAEVLTQPEWRVAPPGFLDRLLTAWSPVTDPLVIVHHLRSPRVPGQGAVTAPHLVALVRAGWIFVHGILAKRPGEDARPAAT
jgi:hypothetical protein